MISYLILFSFVLRSFKSFTKNGKRTIIHWDEDYDDVGFGNAPGGGFSHYDLSWLNWMYGCSGKIRSHLNIWREVAIIFFTDA